MMSGLPTTSDRDQPLWLVRQEELILSLQRQPFLIVVRTDSNDLDLLEGPDGHQSLIRQLDRLHQAGLTHLEVAWKADPRWVPFMRRIRELFPGFSLGAASVTSLAALDDLQHLELPYAMAPCWVPELVLEARRRGLLLAPGVFSPTDVLQARDFGCDLVKLFPAVSVGCDYWRRLQAPLADLPMVVAAGGLDVADVPKWLSSGHGAVALGRRVLGADGLAPELLTWLGGSPICS